MARMLLVLMRVSLASAEQKRICPRPTASRKLLIGLSYVGARCTLLASGLVVRIQMPGGLGPKKAMQPEAATAEELEHGLGV